MSKKRKLLLYGVVLLICLTIFVLQIFVFLSPDGNRGLLLCMICTGGIVYSTVRLYQESNQFQSFFKTIVGTISGFKVF